MASTTATTTTTTTTTTIHDLVLGGATATTNKIAHQP
jgi:hypothetical protein